ncbi:MAG: hypothetical protein FWF81_08450, partial [Defluviitaleaceae bacterium]|nr:hypothetical protein [Defluviitaleaceae bacterium]
MPKVYPISCANLSRNFTPAKQKAQNTSGFGLLEIVSKLTYNRGCFAKLTRDSPFFTLIWITITLLLI